MPERQDRGLIRDPVGDHGDASKATHRRHLDQRVLHCWIAQVVSLLHQMDPQHVLHWIRRPTTLAAGLGVVGLEQIDEQLSRNNRLHLSPKALAPGPLFGRGLLVITKAELLDSHEPCPHLRSKVHSRAGWWGFPESP